MMTFEEAKKIFLNRGFVDVANGVNIFDGDKWRQACVVIGDFLEDLPVWIPVSEGLPEEKESVIVSTKYGVYPEARYTKEYGWEWPYEAGADYWVELENVEAWMPLPKQYKSQESEEA